MDLQEEYYGRRPLRAHMIKYPEKTNLILQARSDKKVEWNWLHITITHTHDNQNPSFYQINVAANPVIYASPDFGHFSYHHTKIIEDFRWEWDAYEDKIKEWADEKTECYRAIDSKEALIVSWSLFLENYDSWLSNFLPNRLFEALARSLIDSEERLSHIKQIEDWLREKHERVLGCWRTIRTNLDTRTYADWLVDMINDPNGSWKPRKHKEEEPLVLIHG